MGKLPTYTTATTYTNTHKHTQNITKPEQENLFKI